MSCFCDPCSSGRYFPAAEPTYSPYAVQGGSFDQVAECFRNQTTGTAGTVFPSPCFPDFCRHDRSRFPSYAFFTTAGTATPVAAGGAIPFVSGTSTRDIVLSGGNILFTRPGVYLITYTVNLAAAAPGVTLSLTLNGGAVAGSTVVTGTGLNFTGQAIVNVFTPGQVLSLVTNGAITVASATISAVRLCP